MYAGKLALAAALAMGSTGAVAGPGADITAQGPQGDLAGTRIAAAPGRPTVLILPGSGPTDRDGNNPLAGKPAPYRMLAEALAERGIGSVRIDKRGMFGSSAAILDANDVTIADYVTDTQSWIDAIRHRTGDACVWLAGHSEGSLVALASAQKAEGVCGLLLISAMGRKPADILREQLEGNPANAPILPDALNAIAALEKGERVDVSRMHPALASLFAPPVQGFLIDLFSHDPAALAAQTTLPVLIVQGEEDIQTSVADAEALAAAQPEATLAILPGVNHVLKDVAPNDRGANMASYSDPELPIAPSIVDAVADFIDANTSAPS